MRKIFLILTLLMTIGCVSLDQTKTPYDISISRIPSGDYFLSTQNEAMILNGTISDRVFEENFVFKIKVEKPDPPVEMEFLSDKDRIIREGSFLQSVPSTTVCTDCTISF